MTRSLPIKSFPRPGKNLEHYPVTHSNSQKITYLFRYQKASSYLEPVLKNIFSTSASNISTQVLQQWQTRLSIVECAKEISTRCTQTLFCVLPCLSETLLMHMYDDYQNISECAREGVNFLTDLHGRTCTETKTHLQSHRTRTCTSLYISTNFGTLSKRI